MAKKPAKSGSGESSGSGGAKKAAPKAAAKASAKAAGGGSSPLIDTNRAANSAAAFVGRKLNLNSSAAPKQESAGFKQMKENLTKPHSQGLSNILDTTNQNKKQSNLPTHGGKQVAQHQTRATDVTRSGVPRRTPG